MTNAIVPCQDIDIVNKFALEHIAQPKDPFSEQPKDFILDSLAEIPQIDWSNIGIECFLGRGSFTHVHKGKILTATEPQVCAIKSLNPSKTTRKAALVDASNDLLNEVLILSQLGCHENIVGLIGILPNLSMESECILFLDCLEETLATRLKRWRKQEPEHDRLAVKRSSNRVRNVFSRSSSKNEGLVQMNARIRHAALGIANGMHYLHERHTIHRDLKPQNIGFAAVTGTVKLFDFGMARKLPEDTTQPNPTTGEIAGTWNYMAPETMQARGSDYASDVYSFGIVWSEICTLEPPFEKKDYRNWHHLKMCIIEGKRPSLSKIPKVRSTAILRRGIQRCWQAESTRRPSCASIYNDLLKYCQDTAI
jgi:serine/threonine protein kinase